jgi:hypothetical protein
MRGTVARVVLCPRRMRLQQGVTSVHEGESESLSVSSFSRAATLFVQGP